MKLNELMYRPVEGPEIGSVDGPLLTYEKDISVVIPVYNSEKTITPLVEALYGILKDKYAFEIILVNDGSSDRSFDVLAGLCKKLDGVVAVNLSKNFGEHNAVMAGFNYARGEYVITMDDDMQNPAEEVVKLIEEAKKGYDVVYGKYTVKKHSFLRNIGSDINDLMADRVIRKPRGLRLTSFRMIRSYVVREIIKYRAPYSYMDGLILRSTRSIGTIVVDHQERKVGRSNYTFGKLVGLWLNGLTNFSFSPLRLSSYAGLAILATGALLAITMAVEALLSNSVIPGWLPVAMLALFLSGVQLLSVGILGEYVGRMFLAQNMTPQFVVREVIRGEDLKKNCQ